MRCEVEDSRKRVGVGKGERLGRGEEIALCLTSMRAFAIFREGFCRILLIRLGKSLRVNCVSPNHSRTDQPSGLDALTDNARFALKGVCYDIRNPPSIQQLLETSG